MKKVFTKASKRLIKSKVSKSLRKSSTMPHSCTGIRFKGHIQRCPLCDSKEYSPMATKAAEAIITKKTVINE